MEPETVAANISAGVGWLEKAGFFQFLLPFGIFFLILYSILDTYKIVSKEKQINALIAFFVSAFLLLYAYYTNVEEFFMLFYTKISVAIIIFVFALTLAVFTYRGLKDNKLIPEGSEKVWGSIIWILSVFIITMAFENAPDPLGSWARSISGIVFAFAVIGAIANLFVGGGKKSTTPGGGA